MSGKCLALVGAGRWGRIHAGVLAQFSSRIERVLWVTRHNKPALDRFLTEISAAAPPFEWFPSLDAALAERPDAAIVVTAASDHAATVETLLRNDVPTLVEKPLTLSVASAKSLIELAEQRKVLLCVALHLLKADFLQHFRRSWSGRGVARIELEWLDPEFETRHGQAKSSDLTTNKADEVVSHLWSMLRVVQDTDEPQLRGVIARSLGTVELQIDAGTARVFALFGRRAIARKRSISLAFHDGGSAELDFTSEPGRILVDGVEYPALAPSNRVGPLAAEIGDFLDIIDGLQDANSSPQLAARCLGSVTLAEIVRERLIESEANALASRLAEGASIRAPDVSAWIVDNIAPLLAAQGQRIASADRQGVAQIIESFQLAVDQELSRVLPASHTNVSEATMAIIKQSRFFALVTEHLLNER